MKPTIYFKLIVLLFLFKSHSILFAIPETVPEHVFVTHMQKYSITESYSPPAYEALLDYARSQYQLTFSSHQQFLIQYGIQVLEGTLLSEDTAEKTRSYYKVLKIFHALIMDQLSPSILSNTEVWFRSNPSLFIVDHDSKGTHPELQIPPQHMMWRSEEQGNVDQWGKMEHWFEEKIGGGYKLEGLRKVLVFRGIKNTGTSPKIMTSDLSNHNHLWKVKWGPETQIEPIANRLYLKLGGKFTDLVYSNGKGKDQLILLLMDQAGQNNLSSDLGRRYARCSNIRNQSRLVYCLKKSNYRFDLRPFIVDYGKTRDILPSILPAISPERMNTPWYAKLKESSYLTFKESGVEFQYKKRIDSQSFYHRIGRSSHSVAGAEFDRVQRGLAIFHFWINNTDPKDDNSRLYLVEDFDKSGWETVEGLHDLGAAFGRTAGHINSMGLGENFISMMNNQFLQIVFHQPLLYKPQAWDKATFQDLQWMVKKIVALKTTEIMTIINHSSWPSFMKNLLTFKLVRRQEQLASAFSVTHLLQEEVHLVESFDHFTIDLSTKEKRQTIADRYQIPLREIELSMVTHGFLKDANDEQPYLDVLVKNGKIMSCHQTILLGILEEYNYPSGLGRRLSRSSDHQALVRCRFQPL